MKKRIFLLVFAMLLTFRFVIQPGIILSGSTWKYQAKGADQGTAGQAPTNPDGSWENGTGNSGHGDNKEATIIRSGPDTDHPVTRTHQNENHRINILYFNRTPAAGVLASDGLPTGPQPFPGRGRGGGFQAREG